MNSQADPHEVEDLATLEVLDEVRSIELSKMILYHQTKKIQFIFYFKPEPDV